MISVENGNLTITRNERVRRGAKRLTRANKLEMDVSSPQMFIVDTEERKKIDASHRCIHMVWIAASGTLMTLLCTFGVALFVLTKISSKSNLTNRKMYEFE